MAGFWAKLFLFVAVWKAGLGILVVLGAVLAVVALFYYLRIGRAIYIAAPDEETSAIEVGRPTAFAIGLAVAGVLLMGVIPGPFIELARLAARGVLGG